MGYEIDIEEDFDREPFCDAFGSMLLRSCWALI
jgi:hypothetical protein